MRYQALQPLPLVKRMCVTPSGPSKASRNSCLSERQSLPYRWNRTDDGHADSNQVRTPSECLATLLITSLYSVHVTQRQTTFAVNATSYFAKGDPVPISCIFVFDKEPHVNESTFIFQLGILIGGARTPG